VEDGPTDVEDVDGFLPDGLGLVVLTPPVLVVLAWIVPVVPVVPALLGPPVVADEVDGDGPAELVPAAPAVDDIDECIPVVLLPLPLDGAQHAAGALALQ